MSISSSLVSEIVGFLWWLVHLNGNCVMLNARNWRLHTAEELLAARHQLLG